MSSKPKILVACKDPGGAEALSPVVLKLISEGEVEITSIGYKFSEDVFKKRKIPFKKLEDFNITEISPTTMEYLLDKEKPDLVVLGTSLGRSIEDDIVLAARKMKIKTFALLDFWNNYSQRFSCLETNKRLAFLPDFIGVMDEFTKEEMIKEGFEPERLLITGQPYFDGLFELAKTFDKEKVIQFRDELNISNSDILISFFSQPLTKTRPNSADEPGYLGYTQLTILNSLIKALYILKKDLGRPITLFVKLHPKETPDEIDDLISGKTIGIAVDKNIDPRKLMLSSDIVCGMFTMILVEAFLIRKKVLSIQIGLKKEDELILSRMKLIHPIYHEEELLPSLRECLLADKSIYSTQFKIYPESTKSVTETIYNLLKL